MGESVKEFVVLDASDTVIDRAAVRKNLTTDGQTGTRTILHADGNFFVGDKIVNGSVIPVEAPGTERQAAKENKIIRISLKTKLKGLGLTDLEIAQIMNV